MAAGYPGIAPGTERPRFAFIEDQEMFASSCFTVSSLIILALCFSLSVLCVHIPSSCTTDMVLVHTVSIVYTYTVYCAGVQIMLGNADKKQGCHQ